MSATVAQANLNQVDLLVKEAFDGGATAYESKFQQVFVVETPQRKDEKFVVAKTSNAVDEVADGADSPEGSVVELDANTITVKVYKSAIKIGDLPELFDNYGLIQRIGAGKGRDFKYKMDELGASFFNNSTSSTAPYGCTISGSRIPLVGDSQTVGDTGTTQDNDTEGALTKTTFNTAYVKMTEMKGHNGNIAGFQVKRFLVPADLHLAAWEMLMSSGEPESANQNKNFVNSLGIELIMWPLLSSATASWLLASKSEVGAYGLRYEVKELPQMRRVFDPDAGIWKYLFRMVVQPGVVDYLGVQGINN